MDYDELAKKFAAEHSELQPKEAEPTAETEEITDEVKAMALAEIVSDPQKAINAKISGAIAEKIDNDETVVKRVGETAEHIIDANLNIKENKAKASDINSQDDINEANFKKYESEYKYHGLDHKVDKPWKTKIISAMNDIWFVIFSFVSFFTIVPVSIFMDRLRVLNGFVKWVYVVLGVMLLLSILFGIVVLIFNACGYDLLSMIGVK